jgi:hypothetical protein
MHFIIDVGMLTHPYMYGIFDQSRASKKEKKEVLISVSLWCVYVCFICRV